ncbi:MAG: hypothetical protein ACYS1A_10525 [Planctomycetota bacterium]|jgi:hypothetical protein
MKSNLKYVMTIPSIDIKGHISINDLALLGSDDGRYKELKKNNDFLSKYLDSFQTPFGKKISPSIVVRDKQLPKVDADHLVSFRNSIAVPSVIYSRARSYLQNTSTGYTSTDLFDFYPVSVSSDGDDLSIKTANTIGVDNRIDKFSGQTTPVETYPEHIKPLFDAEFMLSLLNLIERKSTKKREAEFRNRIIRSLGMTYYALRSPFTQLGNKTDFGVPLSLWVSAFEIIAYHYKKNKNVGFSDVSSLIKKVPWKSYKLRQRTRVRITEKFNKSRTKEKTTLPVQIYGRLYYTRNMYLHGNPIPEDKFEFKTRRGWGNLYFQIPALFRCILMHLLQTNGCAPEFQYPYLQKDYERVLLNPNSP